MLAVTIFVGALAAQAAAPQAQAPASAASTAPAAKPAEPKKVCVDEAKIGSHFKQRICATPEEWERRRLLDTEAMSKRGARSGSTCSGVTC